MAKTIKVVRIQDGTVEEMYPTPGYRGTSLWRKLNKDGGVPGNRGRDGSLDNEPHLYSWARYDQGQEIKANVIRARIEDLQRLVELAQGDLVALYPTVEKV